MLNTEFFMSLEKVTQDHKVKGIIIGLPLQNGVPVSNHCRFIEGFVKFMHREEIIKVPTTFVNENLSTFQAGLLLQSMQVDKGNYDRNFSHNKNV